VLAALALALHDDSSGQVRHADRRIGAVDVLPARARSSESIHPQVFRTDVDLDFLVDLRIDENRSKRCVATRGGIEWRNAHQSMHAHFALQQSVGVFAVDLERRRFNARALALQPVGFDDFEPIALRPAVVHAQKHLGPILTLGAAGSGVDGDNGAFRVVFTRKQHLGFQLRELAREHFHIALQVGGHIFPFAREFEQSVQVGGLAADARVLGDLLLQALAVLHDLLAFFRIRPEVGSVGQFFDLG